MNRKDIDHEATTRALLCLVTDLANMLAAADRLRVQIVALATRHNVAVPVG